MRSLIIFLIAIICFSFYFCTEEGPETPNQDPTGTLIVKSNPSGARIYLAGSYTGKNTPDSLENLKPGTYDAFLHLQYYDTAYFAASIFQNLTTTKEISLHDGLPFVDVVVDYAILYGGDSVRFDFQINQDLLMDSIIVERPIDATGTYIRNNYNFNKDLFISKDQFGNPVSYFLPPSNFGQQNFPRFLNFTYWINFYGQKAYGAQVNFSIFYLQKF